MDELLLPQNIRQRAAVSSGGEHAWRQQDVEKAIVAARDAGLACLGGQVQFQLPEGTCEAYWLNYDTGDRRAGEPWSDFVRRSAAEVLTSVHRLCRETDFRQAALEWDFIRQRVESEQLDPIQHLWFVLYFKSDTGS